MYIVCIYLLYLKEFMSFVLIYTVDISSRVELQEKLKYDYKRLEKG